MGQAVVHFEVIGADAERLRSFYTTLFGWAIDADNPASYGMVDRSTNLNADGGGIGAMQDAPGYVTFYVEVPDVEDALARAERLGGARLMGPQRVNDQVEIGLFNDPEGHMIGVVRAN